MGTGFSVDAKKRDIFAIETKDIVVRHELNGRAFVPDVSDLVASIKEHGQLQPVVVRKDSQSRPVLVAGFRRYLAVCKLNEESIDDEMPVLCRFVACNEEDAFVANIAENEDRKDVTCIDRAHNIARLRKFGKSDEQIAAIYKKSPSWVQQFEPLLTLSKPLQERVAKSGIAISAALQLAHVEEEKRDEVMACLENGGEKITATAVSRAAKEKGSESPKVAKATADKPTIQGVKELTAEFLVNFPGFGALSDYVNGKMTQAQCAKFLKDYAGGRPTGAALPPRPRAARV